MAHPEVKFQKFLELLSENPSVTKAAQLVGISRMAIYEKRDRDEKFRAAWDACKEKGIDALEDYALDRAMAGVSDTMTIFMLKGNRPAKYGDKKEVNLGGNVTVALNMVLERGQKS